MSLDEYSFTASDMPNHTLFDLRHNSHLSLNHSLIDICNQTRLLASANSTCVLTNLEVKLKNSSNERVVFVKESLLRMRGVKM